DGEQWDDAIVPNSALGCALLGAVIAFPTLQNTGPPSDLAWASWGASLGAACLGIFGAFSPTDEWVITPGSPAAQVLQYVCPGLLALLNVFVLACGVFAWIDAHSSDPINNLDLAITVALVTAGLLNPIKLAGEDGVAFVVAIDLLMAATSSILSV